ncbi:MAG: cyclic nucleotide-binding domain-containing protein [Actinomycetes bacterium]
MTSADRSNAAIERFRSIPIFSACTDTELAEIDRVADEVHVEAGRVIMRQGELGQELAIVLEGEVVVERDGTTIATLGPGSHFGEIALLESLTRTASVRAATDVVLEVIDRRGLNTLLDDVPHLARSLLKGVAKRLAELEAASSAQG